MNVIAEEMESAAVMVLSRLFGFRGGAICMCMASLTRGFDNGGRLDVNGIEYSGDRIALPNR